MEDQPVCTFETWTKLKIHDIDKRLSALEAKAAEVHVTTETPHKSCWSCKHDSPSIICSRECDEFYSGWEAKAEPRDYRCQGCKVKDICCVAYSEYCQAKAEPPKEEVERHCINCAFSSFSGPGCPNDCSKTPIGEYPGWKAKEPPKEEVKQTCDTCNFQIGIICARKTGGGHCEPSYTGWEPKPSKAVE